MPSNHPSGGTDKPRFQGRGTDLEIRNGKVFVPMVLGSARLDVTKEASESHVLGPQSHEPETRSPDVSPEGVVTLFHG